MSVTLELASSIVSCPLGRLQIPVPSCHLVSVATLGPSSRCFLGRSAGISQRVRGLVASGRLCHVSARRRRHVTGVAPLPVSVGGGSNSPPGGNNRGGGGGGSGGAGRGEEGAGGQGQERWKTIWASYFRLAEQNPVSTKAITAALLNVVADLFCQLVIEGRTSIDLQRTAGFFAIGFFLVGPSLHYWYGFLPHLIPVPGNAGAVIRLLLDQGIFAPMSLAAFIAILLFLEGRSAEIGPKLQKDLFSTVLAQWKLWIPFQFLNFRFVPGSLQVATAGVVGLIWTVYMSMVSHNDIPPGASPIAAAAAIAS